MDWDNSDVKQTLLAENYYPLIVWSSAIQSSLMVVGLPRYSLKDHQKDCW
jgi:hypothetical protein